MGGFKGGRGAEVDAVLGVELFGEFEDVYVFWFHEFFLDAGGGKVDEITGRKCEQVFD